MADAIILQPDGEHVSDESVKPLASIWRIAPEAIRTIARQMGLVGLGRAAFPTAVKLAPRKQTADTYLLNGAECESLTPDS